MEKVVPLLLIASALFVLAPAEPLRAQSTEYPTKYGQAGMTFLKIDVGARTAALAGTQASVAGTAEDMFTNPAGLSFVEGLDAMTSVNNWIAGIKQYGTGIAYRVGQIGTFGVSLVWMDYGTFRRTAVPIGGTTATGKGYIDQGTFTVSSYAVGLSYGRRITEKFYIGGQVRYAHQDLGQVTIYDEIRDENVTVNSKVSNIVLDFGTLYYTGFRDLRFGVSIRNFSNQSEYYSQRFELPLTFDFGIAMDLLSLTRAPDFTGTPQNQLTLAVDWVHPRDYSERLHVGLEYGLMDTFFLRGGYRFNYTDRGITAGLGVNAELGSLGLRANYAFAPFGRLFDAVHRISLGLSL